MNVHLDESMVPAVSQERFFSNETNKIRLISRLKKKLGNSNFTMKEATVDVDTLIISTAIGISASFDSIFIVGKDIDLLVLLTALARSHPNVHFRKPGRGKIVENIFSPRSLPYGE
ncbi:hypothetical protein JTB14_037264 [Gonioctena quinquepunctata]|nr:hypothetical protein JTB14_037264 [Gonioctena quinquepunctata]